ncbi:unnamed protein product [Prunus brigantina]
MGFFHCRMGDVGIWFCKTHQLMIVFGSFLLLISAPPKTENPRVSIPHFCVLHLSRLYIVSSQCKKKELQNRSE